jgi:hypothetical protein
MPENLARSLNSLRSSMVMDQSRDKPWDFTQGLRAIWLPQ